ncbi:MAG: DUF11 domain-containing protein [Erythrobacter sp.]
MSPKMLASFAACCVLFSSAAHAQQITCDGLQVQSLNFSNGTLTGGSNLQPGAVYRYSNVTTGVDAEFRILSFQNGASIATFDNDAGLNRNLQPELIPNPAGGGFVNFSITFFQAGTNSLLNLDITATQIDVDGDSATLREFVEFQDQFVAFTLNNPTNLDINASGPSQSDRQRFEARASAVAPGIDPTALGNAARATYANTSSFEFALGTLGAGTTTRLTSLSFDCPAFTNPVTTNTAADLVTVKTLTSGSANAVNGDLVTFQIQVTNNGPLAASNVALNDTIPAELTPTGNNGVVSAGTYLNGVWTIPSLALNGSATLTIEGTVDQTIPSGTLVTNTTTRAIGDQNDPSTIGDVLTAATSVLIDANPNLTITKTADDDTLATVGQLVTYTYTITNIGNEIIRDVAVNDAHNAAGPAPTPGNETLLTDNNTIGDSNDSTSGPDGSWDVLAPGDVITFTGTYTVLQADIDNLQ